MKFLRRWSLLLAALHLLIGKVERMSAVLDALAAQVQQNVQTEGAAATALGQGSSVAAENATLKQTIADMETQIANLTSQLQASNAALASATPKS